METRNEVVNTEKMSDKLNKEIERLTTLRYSLEMMEDIVSDEDFEIKAARGLQTIFNAVAKSRNIPVTFTYKGAKRRKSNMETPVLDVELKDITYFNAEDDYNVQNFMSRIFLTRDITSSQLKEYIISQTKDAMNWVKKELSIRTEALNNHRAMNDYILTQYTRY